ncbi:MAG TPA: hypothetical protein VHB20_18205 [Verrucomicrobiae bacterium]|jgi:hypothetical protein|nr:hypothetical protein [Verrucomicrobiae bacterium]
MADTFVPLVRPSAAPQETAFAPIGVKIHSPAKPPSAAEPCRQPSVTLQRDGDKVTSIRIECSCGQIVDLACEY